MVCKETKNRGDLNCRCTRAVIDILNDENNGTHLAADIDRQYVSGTVDALRTNAYF